MHWEVAYWSDGPEGVEVRSGEAATLPERGVAYLLVETATQRRRVQGMDCYWLAQDRFGAYNPLGVSWHQGAFPEGWTPDEYGGRQALFFEVRGEQILGPWELPPPAGARVLYGEWAADERAAEIGM